MIRDISQIQKPKSVLPVLKRTGEYIAVMKSSGKVPAAVTFKPADYDAILKSVEASRQHFEPRISGLRYGDVPVARGGA